MLHADGRSEIRGLALRQNVVKHLAGDAQSFRRGRHGQADRRQDVFPDNLARMDGPKSVPLHVSHISAPPAAITDKSQTRRYTNNPLGTEYRSARG
jgi:hypothetical protein